MRRSTAAVGTDLEAVSVGELIRENIGEKEAVSQINQ